MEATARPHRGPFLSPGRENSQRKGKWPALISAYQHKHVPAVHLMELFVICHSLGGLVRCYNIIGESLLFDLPELLFVLEHWLKSIAAAWPECSLISESESWGTVRPSSTQQSWVLPGQLDSLMMHYRKMLPKQYHISPTRWHSLENKAKRGGTAMSWSQRRKHQGTDNEHGENGSDSLCSDLIWARVNGYFPPTPENHLVCTDWQAVC